MLGTIPGSASQQQPFGPVGRILLVLLGALVLLLSFPAATMLVMRLGLESLGWTPVEHVVDWVMRPVALLLVGLVVGALAGHSGWILSILAACPAVLTKPVVHETPLSIMVAVFQLLVAGAAGYVAGRSRRRASDRSGE